jgi:small subunit ribosomal protein S6
MHEYETLYILKANVAEDAIKKFQDKVDTIISKQAGVTFAQQSQESKSFAYPINHDRRGFYIQLNFAGPGDLVNELERNLRISDEVVRFMTLLVSRDVDVKKRADDWKSGKGEARVEAEARAAARAEAAEKVEEEGR